MTSRRKPQSRPTTGDDSRDDATHVGRIYARIYQVVRQIPHGKVATYGQVAELAGMPGAARVVGTAMRVSTPEMALPWQRVVGKRSATSGRVSIHDPMGAAVQMALLEAEGVVFSRAGSISLARFGWLPTAGSRGRPSRRDRRPRKTTARSRKSRRNDGI